MKKILALLMLLTFLAGSHIQVFAMEQPEHIEVDHDDEEGPTCQK